MAKTKDGRLKCSTELMAEISRHLLAGASMKSTAGSVGIDYSTLKRWLAREGEGKEPFATLCAPLKRARYEAIGNAEQRVYSGESGWQAAARWIESIYPEQWRRTERREISSQVDVRIAWPDLARPGQAAALRRREAVEKALAGGPGMPIKGNDGVAEFDRPAAQTVGSGRTRRKPARQRTPRERVSRWTAENF